jgi:hypothetical protein
MENEISSCTALTNTANSQHLQIFLEAYKDEISALEYLEKNSFKEVHKPDHENACHAWVLVRGVVFQTVATIRQYGGLLLIGGVK